jgi:hypothetical protein
VHAGVAAASAGSPGARFFQGAQPQGNCHRYARSAGNGKNAVGTWLAETHPCSEAAAAQGLNDVAQGGRLFRRRWEITRRRCRRQGGTAAAILPTLDGNAFQLISNNGYCERQAVASAAIALAK